MRFFCNFGFTKNSGFLDTNFYTLGSKRIPVAMDSNESGAGKTVMSYLGNCTYVGLVAMEIKKKLTQVAYVLSIGTSFNDHEWSGTTVAYRLTMCSFY